MKAIKKVEVTPLDLNIGKIIDSASTTDNKAKNTYSMRIIDGKIAEVNQNVNDLSGNVYTKFQIDQKEGELNGNIENAAHGYLLWKNTNPLASFAPQTIELDLSAYDEIEIVYKIDTYKAKRERLVKYYYDDSNYIHYGSVLSNFYQWMSTASKFNDFYSRGVSWNNNGVIFEDCIQLTTYGDYSSMGYMTSSAGHIHNEDCVPLYIIGYQNYIYSADLNEETE